MNQKRLADIFNAAQMDLLAAKVSELYTFGESNMLQSTNEVNAYGKLSVFYVPCGECGNPMHVKEVYRTAVLLACEACGQESETDTLPFVESCYVTIDANEFNRASMQLDLACPKCNNVVSEKRGLQRECASCGQKWSVKDGHKPNAL